MNFPENLRYTKDHEWVSIDGEVGTVGITDYAQGELGDVVFVELPAVGRSVKQHETFGTIEAVKAVSDLFAPLSGSVTEVNKELETHSEVVNKDPYGKGWMIRIKLSQPDELKTLLSAEGYKAIVAK
jgi:glycine cleavage system H protein